MFLWAGENKLIFFLFIFSLWVTPANVQGVNPGSTLGNFLLAVLKEPYGMPGIEPT